MKKSSKNRLTPRQIHLFPSNTLFDRIARTVCSVGTLPRKELYESWEVARRVRRRFRGGRILDLACGHGLLAHILILLDNSSATALAVDTHIPENAFKLSDALVDQWPRLKNRVIYKESRLEDIPVFQQDIVVSVHACGNLTDLVLSRAMEKRAKVAVLPCCHDTKLSPTDGLEGWMDKSLAIDCIRAFTLKQNGYSILTQEIPNEITPKNRLLMGEVLQDRCS